MSSTPQYDKEQIREILAEALSDTKVNPWHIEKNLDEAVSAISAIVAEAQNTPMGVSQWREHGKKYGYWDYFEKQARAEGARGELEYLKRQAVRQLHNDGYHECVWIDQINSELAALNKEKGERSE